MTEYINDFLCDFSMKVIGIFKDHVAVSVPTSQCDFAMQELSAKQNEFVFHGRILSTHGVAIEQVGNA